jgi:hypothetical protein
MLFEFLAQWVHYDMCGVMNLGSHFKQAAIFGTVSIVGSSGHVVMDYFTSLTDRQTI